MKDDDYDDDEYDMDAYESGGGSPTPSTATNSTAGQGDSKKHARAQHNALERRRRDNIKDMYTSLAKELPNFSGDKASRAQILKKTVDTINQAEAEVEDIEAEVKSLEERNAQMKRDIEKQITGANNVQKKQ